MLLGSHATAYAARSEGPASARYAAGIDREEPAGAVGVDVAEPAGDRPVVAFIAPRLALGGVECRHQRQKRAAVASGNRASTSSFPHLEFRKIPYIHLNGTADTHSSDAEVRQSQPDFEHIAGHFGQHLFLPLQLGPALLQLGLNFESTIFNAHAGIPQSSSPDDFLADPESASIGFCH
jgi:hypothetical protein